MQQQQFIIIIIIIIVIMLASRYYYNTIRVNWLVLITVLRGIVSPNCFWWTVNDWFHDTTGVDLYRDLKQQYGKLAPINILGTTYYLITDSAYIRKALDNSPHIFGVGKLKNNFFQTFMRRNLGVSTGCPWKRRRRFNEHVLATGRQRHPFAEVWDQDIRRLLLQGRPRNFQEFSTVAKQITMKVLFGTTDIYGPVFDIFQQANRVWALLFGQINIETLDRFQNFVRQQLRNPTPNSLIWLASQQDEHLLLEQQELMDQVPHWIFPIVGTLTLTTIRILILLDNHPRGLRRARRSMVYLRHCILETLRLNNPVSSTFRTLLDDFSFDGGRTTYKRGTQMLILNNPVLRDPDVFPEPHRFRPERWDADPSLEDSYSALMFNQGPQKCPGKDLILLLLESYIGHYLALGDYGTNIRFENIEYIPQMINPCKVKILFR
jgi:cytochrome P450